MAEWARLESEYTRKGIVGSNPTPTASSHSLMDRTLASGARGAGSSPAGSTTRFSGGNVPLE